MRILFINTWMHPKNLHALLSYKNIYLEIINNISDMDKYDLSKFDCVYSPTNPIDVLKYPGVNFIFGPHFSVFPDNNLALIQNSKYIVLSEWVKNMWGSYAICKELKLIDIPFGVDTDRFCEVTPIEKRQNFFIYFKSRHPQELQMMEQILRSNNMHNYIVFNYEKKYNEQEYLKYLQQAKFGIWIGRHESQGFSLEEALSCNVPLLVWNVHSMTQEYGQYYPDVPATAIPYWDERCGEFFYNINELQEKISKFFNNLESYKPREYVVENLSTSVCEKRFIDMILELKNNS